MLYCSSSSSNKLNEYAALRKLGESTNFNKIKTKTLRMCFNVDFVHWNQTMHNTINGTVYFHCLNIQYACMYIIRTAKRMTQPDRVVQPSVPSKVLTIQYHSMAVTSIRTHTSSHHRFLLASNNRVVKKSGPTNNRIETKRLSEAIWMGPTHFFHFIFVYTLWNMTKLLSFDANFFSSVNFEFEARCFFVELKVSNLLVSRYWFFSWILHLMMAKPIYNLSLKALNETGDNKDMLWTFCWLIISFLKWLLMPHFFHFVSFFLMKKNWLKLVSHFDHISCGFDGLKLGSGTGGKVTFRFLQLWQIISEHGSLFSNRNDTFDSNEK